MSEDFKIVRWREWDGPGIEHLELRQRAGEVLADPSSFAPVTPFSPPAIA
ncbi:hypothetical protein MesoLj113a_47870 [Mesorhizobium sp. 113-1-2]|nr:hypothetical protein [Mesorhizobium sp. 113-1-2]BAV45128.1 hypothetical protein MLTONO_0225 [Mesorhizobium loti]BCG73629.1 hypothetical protein MesoLj113a_47870 [Mesorhizobium sp. 113-1-2]